MMTLKIGNRLKVEVVSYEEASAKYSELREASLEGASTFPSGTLHEGRKKVAVVSYNGKVWTPEGFPKATLLYSPYEE